MTSARSADGQAAGSASSRGPEGAALSAPPGQAQLKGWDQQAGRGYLKARLYAVRREYSRVLSEMIVLDSGRRDGYWQRARAQLDEAETLLDKLDAQAAAMAISQADQALVHLAQETSLERRAREVADELESRGLHAAAERLKATCEEKSAVGMDGRPLSDDHRQELADALAGAIDQVAQSQQEEWLNNDLQVARLRLLALYATAALVLTLAATMIAANRHPVRGWPVAYLASWPAPFASLAASAGVVVLGAAGGLFSGLLAIQGAKTSLLGYRTSVLRLILKPLVGALMACIVYIALSWQVVPGITVTNGGTFLVVGFVTGFSERYILRILNVPGASDSDSGQGGTPGGHQERAETSQGGRKSPRPQRGTTGFE
jgi:hypothetical protein